MNALVSNVRIKARAAKSRMYVLSPEKAARYTVEFLLFLLFSSVDEYGFALSTALLIGLTYARQNLVITSPLYYIAGIIFIGSWWTFLQLATAPIILGFLYFAFWRIKRNVPVWTAVPIGLISSVPYVVLEVLNGGNILPLAVSATVVALFSLCCSIGSYAILIRGIKCRLTLDEKIACGMFLFALAYSTYCVNIYNFRLYWLLLPVVLLLFSDERDPAGTLTVAVLAGLGSAVSAADISLVGVSVILASCMLALKLFTRFASAAGAVVVLSILWLIGCNGCNWQAIVLLSAGGLLYCILPSDLRKYFAGSADNSSALNALVNRNRTELSARLSAVGEVFGDMSDELSAVQDTKCVYTAKRLASEVAKSYCGRCADRENCFSALGGDTAPVLEPMASAVLARGKTTILDTPTFITSRCNKMNNLTAVMNNAGEAYRRRIEYSAENLSVKKLLSEQFAGVSLVLDALSKECGEHLSFGEDEAERLENELLKHNIVAKETVITGNKDKLNVTVTVRECDAKKTVLPRIVSNCLKTRMSLCEILPKGEERIVHLTCSPLYEVVYGIAEKKRNGEDVSGDSKTVLTPSPTKLIFALSDGMGGGEVAAKASSEALKMVENFYRAGFDNALILSLINKLLCLSGDETFSSLDIAVIDTASGGADIIKLGAASGFVVRKNSIEVICSTLPPAGILDKVEPVTDRYQLYDGDMLILASDGVVDALGERGVTAAVEEINTLNPQSLADGLLLGALSAGSTDDCSVLVMRLIAV